jgi:hypothetical protein
MIQLSVGSRLVAFEWYSGYRRGAVRISGESVTTTPVDVEQTVKQFEPASGVKEEVAAWTNGIMSGTSNPL